MELSKEMIFYIEEVTKATLRHEGKEPTQKGKAITHKFLLGKITSTQAINEIIKAHGRANKEG
jgi:hypothetical protein